MQISSDGSKQNDPAFTEKAVINGREVTIEFLHHAISACNNEGCWWTR